MNETPYFCRHQLEKSLLVDPWNTVKEADISMMNIYFIQSLLRVELSYCFVFYLCMIFLKSGGFFLIKMFYKVFYF